MSNKTLEMLVLYKVLATAPRPGLQLKEVQAHRGGTTYATHRWLSPAEVAEAEQKGTLVQPQQQAAGGESQQKAEIRRRFVEERAKSPRQEFLSPKAEQDLVNHTVVLMKGGKVGYAISPEGDLQNLFNNNGKGAGGEAIIDAIVRGGKTCDCFDGALPKIYERFGFVRVRDISWDDQYAPANWDYAKWGRPNVVFMEYRGNTRDANEIRQIAVNNGYEFPQGEQG